MYTKASGAFFKICFFFLLQVFYCVVSLSLVAVQDLPFTFYFQVLLHGISDPKADGQKAAEKAQEKRLHQPLPLVSESQTHPSFQSQPKQPQVLSQQLPFIFQSSQAKEESVNKHTSVIQSTGLVSNVKPLSLVNQAKKEAYMKLIVPSPEVPKAGNKNTSEESSSLTSELRSKRVSPKQIF